MQHHRVSGAADKRLHGCHFFQVEARISRNLFHPIAIVRKADVTRPSAEHSFDPFRRAPRGPSSSWKCITSWHESCAARHGQI